MTARVRGRTIQAPKRFDRSDLVSVCDTEVRSKVLYYRLK